ncbi:hypothetical protein QTP88_023405 [Uroleucon formosanum]
MYAISETMPTKPEDLGRTVFRPLFLRTTCLLSWCFPVRKSLRRIVLKPDQTPLEKPKLP